MKRLSVIAAIALLALTACHSFKKENVQPPTKLTDITPTVTVTRLWKSSVGNGASDSGIRMRPAYADGVIYAASTDGSIAAFDAKTGHTLWNNSSRTQGWFGWGDKKRPDAFYAGGPAASDGLVVVGTLDGHVYALDAKSGSTRWQATLSSEVIVAPAIVGDIVVVRTNDGRLYGLDAATGKRKWAYDQSTVPLLSLRGNGPMLVANGVVFFGSDDGHIVALRLETGEKLWDLPLSTGEGSTDVERLNDADGAIILDGTTLYADAYHGQLIAIDGPSGRPLWQHPFSTYTSLDVSGNTLVGIDDSSQVWAFDKASGSDLWKQEGLKWRWLSAPAVQGNYVVVGDLDGYVHWLQIGDGAFAGRERLSGKAIRAQPLVVGNIAYVEDVEGHIGAYSIGAVR